jgi:hypothetical protein
MPRVRVTAELDRTGVVNERHRKATEELMYVRKPLQSQPSKFGLTLALGMAVSLIACQTSTGTQDVSINGPVLNILKGRAAARPSSAK